LFLNRLLKNLVHRKPLHTFWHN